MPKWLAQGEGFEVHFNQLAGLLRAQVEGRHDSFEISVDYWTVISDERRRCGARQVLVIENIVEDGRPEQLLALFDHLVVLGFEGCKVAFVDNGNEQLSNYEHIAILAREQGILAAVFSEEGAAEIWLRHGEQ